MVLLTIHDDDIGMRRLMQSMCPSFPRPAQYQGNWEYHALYPRGYSVTNTGAVVPWAKVSQLPLGTFHSSTTNILHLCNANFCLTYAWELVAVFHDHICRYIVYDVSQINMKFLLKMKCNFKKTGWLFFAAAEYSHAWRENIYNKYTTALCLVINF